MIRTQTFAEKEFQPKCHFFLYPSPEHAANQTQPSMSTIQIAKWELFAIALASTARASFFFQVLMSVNEFEFG